MRPLPSPEQERRKRRRELIVALAATVLIAGIIAVEYQAARTAENLPLGGHLLLFGLLSLVTLLLILVIFFLIRNLFKLIFERRQGVLGANLKTRLTLAFVAMTLVPTIVLFLASAGVVHTTIESWFKSQVEESLQSALVVAQAYSRNTSEMLMDTGTRIADAIRRRGLLAPERRVDLARALAQWRAADKLASVQVHYRGHRPPLIKRDPSMVAESLPEARRSLLKIAFQNKITSTTVPLEHTGGDLLRAVAPIESPSGGTPDAVLVVDYQVPTSLAGRLRAISSAFGDYQEAKRMGGPVKTTYVLILLVVALLVIFIGSWFGMTIARDITDPIQRLADGTGKIAAGDLDVYVEPMADDELGALVKSFNQMASDLRKSRDELMRVNIDLDGRRKYMETVLKNVAAGVLATGSDGRITALNNSARRLLQIADNDAVGRPVLEVLPEVSGKAVAEILNELSASGRDSLERQVTLSFPDKSLSLICFANSLADEEGRDLGVALVFEDMTYLVKAQRMTAWREVARRIAHEIKNPLTPIQLNAQRIRRKYMPALEGDSTVLDQCTSAIIDQVEQLKTMVNEFSKFARMPSANPTANDLNAVIREVTDLYAQGNEDVRFSFTPDSRVPIFDLDKEQIKRALMNLLENAVAAVGDHGAVDTVVTFDQRLSIATIEVSDNGPGVPRDDADRLFEPYFSTKAGGSGLGLTIVHRIVSDHNGFIRVKNNTNGGARFIIELPVGNVKPSTLRRNS